MQPAPSLHFRLKSMLVAHWRVHTIEDAFVTFSLNPDGSIDSARMAAVSPLADFSFDYQDLLLKPAGKK